MKKTSIVLIVLLIVIPSYGQQKTMSEQLWDRVQECYKMFIDEYGDEEENYADVIDDSNNGYLKVSGSYPTCGCSCESTVGAFRNDDDTFLFLEENVWSCSWAQAITASKDLNKVFPIDFESDGFFSQPIEATPSFASFYIDIEIPRRGTDTKVWLKNIPIGIDIKSDQHITWSYSYDEGYSESSFKVSNISKLAQGISHPETLQLIIDNDFDKISALDIEVIKEIIDPEQNSLFKNKEELTNMLIEVKRKYDLYTQIKYQWLLLGWDRIPGAFYIKEKGGNPKQMSFIEFLKTSSYWTPTC